jgi:hypothetical protein
MIFILLNLELLLGKRTLRLFLSSKLVSMVFQSLSLSIPISFSEGADSLWRNLTLQVRIPFLQALVLLYLSLICLTIELLNFWEELQDLISCVLILQVQRQDLLVNGHEERSQHSLMKEDLIAVESWNSLCLYVIDLNMIGAMNGIIECSIKVECD